ncbi:MAG: hypothetical protein ABI797_01580 [Chloroflexota bacterium]
MRRTIGIALTAAILALAMVAPTSAFAASTLVVDDDGFGTAANCNAATPAYATIQSAVNAAAAGDTVKVCPGTYAESVTVSTWGLKLVGAHVGLNAKGCPSRSGTSMVMGGAGGAFNFAADGVVIDGFLISGGSAYGIETSELFSGYLIRNNVIELNAGGIYLNASGSIHTRVKRNCFRENNNTFYDVTPFPTAGTGIYTDQGLQNANIYGNGFRGHLNLGINLATTLDGTGMVSVTDTGNVRVAANVSKNDRVFLAIYNAHHIYVSGNTVRQNASGQDWNGSAIYVGGGSDIGGEGARAITVTNNSIRSKNVPNGFYAGIAVRGSAERIVVTFNTINGTYNGISISSDASDAAFVHRNAIWNAHNNGIEALVTDPYVGGGPATQNYFSVNTAHGSANFDCYDDTSGDSTLGTANTWRRFGPSRNIGDTSSPTGLCATN